MIDQKCQDEFNQMCKNIKLLREKKKISRKELSKASGVSEYMIGNFEKGIITERMNVEHLFRLCNFFDVKIHEIFLPLQ